MISSQRNRVLISKSSLHIIFEQQKPYLQVWWELTSVSLQKTSKASDFGRKLPDLIPQLW